VPSFSANGLETHYEVAGSGTPVLFIHGGFGGAEATLYPQPSAFRDVLPRDRFQTITYDRRNGGRSGYVPKRLRIEDLADDARRLVDHLSLERTVVVGDSLGGMVAICYALRHPEKVDLLLLAETGASLVQPPPHVKLLVELVHRLPKTPMLRLFRRRLLNPPLYPPLGPTSPDLEMTRRARHQDYVASLGRLPPSELRRYSLGLFHNYAAFVGRDLSPYLHRLAMQVHILHGTADSVVGSSKGEALHASIPRSRLHLLDGLGHGLFYYCEASDLTLRILDEHGS
jgi:pimeloyl-ACP methyl ester carboxylesterase